jgi:integrase
MVSYDWKQAKAIIDRLPLPYRALEALMAGTGMEWSACAALQLSDIDFDARKVDAKGTKNRHRNRTVKVTEPWAWSVFEKYARTFTFPAERLFELDPKTALEEHRKALVLLGLPDSTLHDWRHTYAVNKLREGMRPAVVRHQLGHAKNSTEVERIYGVSDVRDSDYETTTSATTAKKQREVRRAN